MSDWTGVTTATEQTAVTNAAFYKRLKTTADRLLKKKGQAIKVYHTTPGVYDPETGTIANYTTMQECTGAIFDYGTKQIDGTLIKVGDKQLLLSAFQPDGSVLPAPVLGDTVAVGGVTYTLVEPLKEVNPAGTVVLFDVNLRCG